MISEIPLQSRPHKFSIRLENIDLIFIVKWNDRSSIWTVDIIDVITNAPLLYSIPLVLGQNLLEPYHFNIGAIIMVDTTNQGADANISDLGTRVKMVWFSASELV